MKRFSSNERGIVKSLKMTGAIYIANGLPHLVCALNSIQSLKIHNPGIQVTLATDCSEFVPQEYCQLFSRSISLPKGSDPRLIKTKLTDLARFEKNVFIDADTVIHGSLNSGFFYLDYFDIALRPHPSPLLPSAKGGSKVFNGQVSLSDLPHWNSGVLFFRNNTLVKQFFEDWHTTYTNLTSPFDQVSLVEALFRFQGKIAPLDHRWNATTAQFFKKKNSVVVQHFTSDIDDYVQASLFEVEQKILKNHPQSLTSFMNNWVKSKLVKRLEDGKKITANRDSVMLRYLQKARRIVRYSHGELSKFWTF